MKRLALILAALLASSPAWSAEWVKVADGTGPSATNPHLTVVGDYVYVVQLGATSATDAITLINTSGWGISTASFTAPSTATSWAIRGSGGDATKWCVGGGGNSGSFITCATPPTFSSWATRQDNSSDLAYGGTFDPFGLGYAGVYNYDTTTDEMGAFSLAIPSGYGQASHAENGYTLNQLAGCKVSSSYYLGASIIDSATDHVHALGIDGSNAAKWTVNCGTGTGCELGILATTMRPCFTDGTYGFTTTYSTTSTHIIGWNGSGAQTIETDFASIDVRPGFTFDLDGEGAKPWAFKTDGDSYQCTGTGNCWADESDGDITLDGGDTLSGCVLAASGAIPVCTTTGRDVWAWTTPAAPASGAPRATSLTRGLGSTLGGTL